MNITLSILMLCAVALIAGGTYLLVKRGERKQGSLMIVLAVIMIANIAIWTVPDATGDAPIDSVSEEDRESLR